ncbi:MAG: bifunctional helix-turn-helix domain-containing protein/methylated-DNA--[protein]-cysteine S-methyltransferase [Nitratireductor sp.]|nr:bifunctional helix-turn-helix domain-containing protein/methylated-DNA--[protein]-cysteine S-methyltransferase [Nitratireductor sp.]MCB1457868.1 bifunctional helix-turn-helix domain-containing protein/methylated-DNA--[protein]-cysteine S-methyltransferase [Nitratireductor sp.]
MGLIDQNSSDDYQTVRRCIELISQNWRDQPELEELALAMGLPAERLQKTFTRWAGLSPKAFLQAVTLDHARRLLDEKMPILDASYELGLSGPGRLHDLFVTHEAMSPGVYKAKGEGLEVRYGFHSSPFGLALAMVTERGLAGLAFCDPGGEAEALEDMKSRWPRASYVEDRETTAHYARRAFDPQRWSERDPLRVVLIGTDFEVRVWQGLLQIPVGTATSYSRLAGSVGAANAPRAVGRAVGRNPVSFVVPCHRVVGKGGALTGYHWGLTRKRAMLGWEAGFRAGN